MKSKYKILRITEWGTVHYVNNNLKYCKMKIKDYLKFGII
jgi:hypothetical protein